jgi:hypothetical protein
MITFLRSLRVCISQMDMASIADPELGLGREAGRGYSARGSVLLDLIPESEQETEK